MDEIFCSIRGIQLLSPPKNIPRNKKYAAHQCLEYFLGVPTTVDNSTYFELCIKIACMSTSHVCETCKFYRIFNLTFIIFQPLPRATSSRVSHNPRLDAFVLGLLNVCAPPSIFAAPGAGWCWAEYCVASYKRLGLIIRLRYIRVGCILDSFVTYTCTLSILPKDFIRVVWNKIDIDVPKKHAPEFRCKSVLGTVSL